MSSRRTRRSSASVHALVGCACAAAAAPAGGAAAVHCPGGGVCTGTAAANPGAAGPGSGDAEAVGAAAGSLAVRLFVCAGTAEAAGNKLGTATAGWTGCACGTPSAAECNPAHTGAAVAQPGALALPVACGVVGWWRAVWTARAPCCAGVILPATGAVWTSARPADGGCLALGAAADKFCCWLRCKLAAAAFPGRLPAAGAPPGRATAAGAAAPAPESVMVPALSSESANASWWNATLPLPASGVWCCLGRVAARGESSSGMLRSLDSSLRMSAAAVASPPRSLAACTDMQNHHWPQGAHCDVTHTAAPSLEAC